MFKSLGLPSLTSLTMVLLKLLTLPLPIPVKKNGIIRSKGVELTTIPKNPKEVINERTNIAFFLPI